MRYPQPLRSAAGHVHGLHGHLDGLHYGRGRHDEARDDHEVDATSIILMRLLSGVKREPVVAVSQILGIGKAGTEYIRHNGRFGQQVFHSSSPKPSRLLDAACGKAPPNRAATATTETAEPTENCGYASQFVNGCNNRSLPASAQHLSQVTEERSCCTVGQNQTPDNAAFCIGGIGSGDIDPSDNSQLTVHGIDFSTFNEGVLHNHRLGKRWFWIMGSHHSTGGVEA